MNEGASGLVLVAWCAGAVLTFAGCSSTADVPSAQDPSPTPPQTSASSPTPSPSKHMAPNIDWSAPPDYVRFSGWQIDRFPVPRGSQPTTDDGQRDDFSAYVIFEGGDIERISAFYEKVLRRAGYAIDVDDYGTVRFAGNRVEGGVVEDHGRDVVAVVINRSSA